MKKTFMNNDKTMDNKVTGHNKTWIKQLKSKVISSTLAFTMLVSALSGAVANNEAIRVHAANGTAAETVGIAASQVGYKEKASNYNLDDFNANAGGGNYTKYARDIGVTNGQAWCAAFVWWCCQSANVPSGNYPRVLYATKDWWTARGLFKARGTYIPKPGDYIVFDWDGNGLSDHCGIVESANASTINTIEGNSSDQVKRKTYSSSYSCIMGYGVINYNSGDSTPPSISNVKVSNVTLNGYTVTCNVSDNVGVTKVEFPTWTDKNGQDDLIWHQGSVSNGVATFNVKSSDHKNEKGTYITHIYAWDAAGNKTCVNAGGYNLAQLGSVQDLGTGFYGTITNTKIGTALTVSGTNVVANTETGEENQLWYFEKQSDGSYKITSKSTGKILDVANGGDVDRTNVGIYQSNDAPCQRFKFFKANNNGYFVKANCAESTILDLAGNSSANGTNIQVYTIHKQDAEIFSVNKYYTVRFVNDNRTVSTQFIKSGKAAKAPELSKEGCQCSWDKDISNITADITVKAVWNETQQDPEVVVEKVVAKSATNHKTKAFQYKFNKIAGVDGYEFYYGKLKSANLKEMKKQVKKTTALNVSGLKRKNIKATSNSISVSKCTKNKTYYMTMRAYRVVDGEKVYGPYSAIKSVKIVK